MKKKIISLLLITTLSMTGCGSTKETDSEPTKENVSTETEQESSEIKEAASEMVDEALSEITTEVSDAANNIESDSNLLTIEVTLPSSVDDISDSEIEELKKEDGYISITRNEDNSITYVMTKAKQHELMNKLKSRFDDFAATTPGSADYPNVTKLEVNNDFSKFTITTTATSKDEISLSETALAAVFYSFGGAYRGYACDSDTSVTVEYVCDSTGEVIATGNSADIQ